MPHLSFGGIIQAIKGNGDALRAFSPVQLLFSGGITPKGEYASGTTYATGDGVSYGGQSYVAIQATTGNLPTNTTYWQILAEKGTNGVNGADGADGSLFNTSSSTSFDLDAWDWSDKTLTVSSGLSWAVGNRVLVFSRGSGAWFEGDVVSYSGTTLVIDPKWKSGSGVTADWNVLLTGIHGSTGPTGPQGPAGADGADGVNSINMLNGSGIPSAGLGVDGDYYLDDDTGDMYQKQSGAWVVVANIEGPQGETGATGPQGPQGETGATGPQGPQGPAGADGEKWYSGSGSPSGATGAVGDWYLDTDTGDVYEKTGASTWTLRMTIKYQYEGVSRQTIINGGFTVNQRVYVSSAVLASGSYAHDRWKAGAGGGDYTFTQLASSTQITIKSGKSLIQVVENKNVVGGTYTLSWEGTAQARFGINSATPSGSYASSPITITGQTAGTVMSVEFYQGTLGKVQLNSGSVALSFQPKSFEEELRACQRYYEVLGYTCPGLWLTPSIARIYLTYQVTKRVSPTFSLFSSTPNIEKPGVIIRTGSGSTIYSYANTSVSNGFVEINGFSGATIDDFAQMDADYIGVSAEL